MIAYWGGKQIKHFSGFLNARSSHATNLSLKTFEEASGKGG